MEALDTRQLGDLQWRQPSALSRKFELVSGESCLGTLQFVKALGTLAKGNAGGGPWTFKRTGFLNPVVTARVEGSQTDIATFQAKWTARSGILVLGGGEALTMKALNFWGSEWGIEDGAGQLLLRIHERGMVHFSAKYEVSEAGKRRADMGLLLCLSWYVLVLMCEDSTT